jgi:hypothetical protein
MLGRNRCGVEIDAWASLDVDPRTHQGGDDVVSDFSIRVRQAATSDDVKDASRWWTRPQERIVRLETSPFQAEFSGTKSAVRLRAHGVQSLELPAGVQAAWQRQPDVPCGYLASRQVRRKLNMVAS